MLILRPKGNCKVALMKDSTGSEAHTIPSRDRSVPCPLSPAQESVWFVEQLSPEALAYNGSEAVRLTGSLDVGALERGLNIIVARHEILRTTIQTVNGKPAHVIHEDWCLEMKRLSLEHLPPEQRNAEVERLLIEEPRRRYQLDSEPGIRATLIKLADNEHVFILMMHHMICDWSSEGVLWRELSASYRGLIHGKSTVLPPLAIQHGDYAVWQKQMMDEGAFDGDLDYWETTLRGAPGLLELPADRPRPATITYRGARKRFRIGSELVKALRDCSWREKTRLFTLFAAALNCLFYRYTGSEDISVGVPIADRDRRELQSMVGFLLRVHVLRTQLSGAMTFRALMAQVENGVLDLYAHRSPPFDQIVSRVKPERNASYSPLFQVLMNWRDREQQPTFIGIDGLAVESLLAETRTSKFDLTFMLTDDEDEIWLEIEYSTDLFDSDRIERMVGHYRTILGGAAANPDRRLLDLPLLPETERHQILVEWNRTKVDYSRDKCLHQLIEEQARRTPEAIALRFEEKQLTYGELNTRANQLARHLRELGVGPDVLVGICLERSLEMVVGLLGILKAGGAYLPLDPEYPKERIEFVLQDAQTTVLLTQERLLALAGGCQARVFCLDSDWWKVAHQERSDLSNPATSQNLAYVIYTSGSTGKPKGVQIPHRAVVNFMQSMAKTPGLAPQDILLAVTTLSFDIAGLELWLPLTLGAQAVIARRDTGRDGQALAQLLDGCGATVMQATPSTWQLLLSSGWAGAPRLKILCGGEAWSKELAQQLLKKSASLWNMYGPTETTIWSAACRVESGDGVFIGKPINNTQIYILDKQLQPVPPGLPGELHIGGVGLARGYHNRPELTSEKFIADPFSKEPGARLYKTGDSARFLPNGNIEYLGRLDYQVKIRGYRVELGEIEEVLNQHPGVQASIVIAREDSPGAKRLVAYLVSQKEGVSAATLRDYLRDKMPGYMVPAAFVTLPALPLTPNGKVDRKALPAPESANVELEREQKMPRSYTEQMLCHIWREWLNLERVGTQDNFFDLGGDSLTAIRVIEQMNQTFKVHLNVPVFFRNPTIEQLARLLEQEHNIRPVPQLVSLHAGTSTGSLFIIEAGMGLGLCRLVESFHGGPAAFATVAPLSPKAHEAALHNHVADYPSLEELAAPHAALIRKNYSSPCWLIGHCLGGMLAVEAARQLQNDGMPVEMIFLLDSWARIPTPSAWNRLRHKIREGVGQTLKRRATRFWKEKLSRPASAESRHRGTGSSPAVESIPHNLLDPQSIDKIFKHIRKTHQMKPLQGRAVLFRPQEPARDQAIYYEMDAAMGWNGTFTGGMEILECPGDHFLMLKAPHLQFLAQQIWQRLQGSCASTENALDSIAA